MKKKTKTVKRDWVQPVGVTVLENVRFADDDDIESEMLTVKPPSVQAEVDRLVSEDDTEQRRLHCQADAERRAPLSEDDARLQRLWGGRLRLDGPEFHPPLFAGVDRNAYPRSLVAGPIDPLDVQYDGLSLRRLLVMDEARRSEWILGAIISPAQRAAVSAHWSAELRARVTAAKAKTDNRITYSEDDEP